MIATRIGREPRRAERIRQRRADVRIMRPLAKLSPGRYVFRIDATLGQRTASRGVPFIVE